MDCTYFQNKCLFSIFILSLSHDLVLGKPMNVVLMCILELLNPAILCLLQQLLVGYPCCSSTECHRERTWSHALSSDCSMVCHGCDVFSTHLLIIAIPVIFENVDFFQYSGCVHCKDLL